MQMARCGSARGLVVGLLAARSRPLRPRLVAPLVAPLVMMALLAGCGGKSASDEADSAAPVATSTPAAASASSSGSSSASEEGIAPEDLRAPADQVAAGLRHIKDLAAQVAAAAGVSAEEAPVDEIETAWRPIEGTIKENDKNAYLTFEDQFAFLADAVEAKDADRAKQASDAIAGAADAYLAHYGYDPTASPSPTESWSPTPSATP